MLLSNLNLLATAPGGVARLRELILTLAVQGKLVQQDPSDEPASELLKKIRAEKDRLIAAKALKREKDEPALTDDALPFDLPATWSWVALGEVIDIVRGITFPATQKTREAAPGRIACLRTSNVQQTIEWDDLLFVDRSFMGREDQIIQHHDIVMSMANSRELVGKVALIDQIPHAEATFGGFLGVLRPRKIDPRYAMAVLRTPYARALLIDSSSQTTNIANVSLAKLRPLPFPLPPEAEQSRIVTRVEELMRLCDALEAKGQLEATQHAQLVSTLLATLTESETPAQLADNWHRIATHFDLLLDRPEAVDALEQTILQLAVRGLLVPQDPQDEPASELLKKIRTEKDKLITEGKIKRDKPLPPIAEDEPPFSIARWVGVGAAGRHCRQPTRQDAR
jgi:type I restriction enzyme S subunit